VLVYLKKELGASMGTTFMWPFTLTIFNGMLKAMQRIIERLLKYLFFHQENPLASSNVIDFTNLVKFRLNSIEIG
jgi:hypothetical protein